MDKMVFGGTCLTKIDGKAVFVSGALPGETVDVEIIESKKDYCKAHTTKVLTVSESRQKPFCPLYEECGGCDLQHAKYQYQLQLKKDIIHDCLRRSGVQIPFEIETIYDQSTEYRNRFQFSYGGLKAKNSHSIVILDDCPCADENIRVFLKSNNTDLLNSYSRLHIFASDKAVGKTCGKKLILGLEGESELTLNVLGKEIVFDARGFFQSNIAMLEKTIPLIIKGLQGKHLIDMYSGVGTLSLFAKDSFKEITLVEHNKRALEYAKLNFAHTENIKTYSMTGEQWAKKATKKKNDALIIDPPRSGIERELCTWICNEKIKTIRYLSCNISTFARDSKKLLEAGYCIEKLYFLDYYPHTSHIECLAYFTYINEGSEK